MKYLDKDGLTYLWGKIKAKIPTKTSDLTNDSGFTTFSGNYNDLTNKPTIPAALSAGSHIDITSNTIKNTGVWEVSASDSNAANGTIKVVTGTSGGDSTVNVGVKGLNNAAYKNVDTTISSSGGNNLPTSTAVKNFVEGKGYITSYTETDPVFSASAAAGISSTDITNWNGKISGITSTDVTTALGYTPYNSTNPNGYTSNTGTITEIKMNNTSKGTSGVVDLGTVITSLPTATTSRAGIVQLSSATNSTSTTLAATPTAVRSAYNRASTALTTAESKVGAWTAVGSATQGNASQDLPDNFSELLCIVKVDNNDNLLIPIVVPQPFLTTSEKGFNGGYSSGASSIAAAARVLVTTTTIKLGQAYLNNANKLTTSYLLVYYR